LAKYYSRSYSIRKKLEEENDPETRKKLLGINSRLNGAHSDLCSEIDSRVFYEITRNGDTFREFSERFSILYLIIYCNDPIIIYIYIL